MLEGFFRYLHWFVLLWFVVEQGLKFARWLRKEPTDTRKIRSRADYLRGISYSLICAILWSGSYVSLSYVSGKVDLFEINVVLLGSASLFLLLAFLIAYLLKQGGAASWQSQVDWKSITPWTVTVSNIASFILFVYALYFISASQTITLQKINPLFIALGTWVVLKRAPSRSTISTVALVVIGTVLITANDQFRFGSGKEMTGSLLAILAGASFAVFSVGLEKIEQRETSLVGRIYFMGIVFLLSYTAVVTVAYFQHRILLPDRMVMAILVANGLRIALVYGLYHAAIRRIGALFVSVIVALEVPLTMFWDSLFLHQFPRGRLIWGAVAILLGALTLTLEKSPDTPRQA
jgi:drug/metabolite transporter (DMT)-like permease